MLRAYVASKKTRAVRASRPNEARWWRRTRGAWTTTRTPSAAPPRARSPRACAAPRPPPPRSSPGREATGRGPRGATRSRVTVWKTREIRTGPAGGPRRPPAGRPATPGAAVADVRARGLRGEAPHRPAPRGFADRNGERRRERRRRRRDADDDEDEDETRRKKNRRAERGARRDHERDVFVRAVRPFPDARVERWYSHREQRGRKELGENQNRFVRDRSLWTVSGSARRVRARLARARARRTRAREKRVVDVGGAGHFPLGRKRDGPPDARGWARMGLVRVRRARSDRSSQSQSVGPQFRRRLSSFSRRKKRRGRRFGSRRTRRARLGRRLYGRRLYRRGRGPNRRRLRGVRLSESRAERRGGVHRPLAHVPRLGVLGVLGVLGKRERASHAAAVRAQRGLLRARARARLGRHRRVLRRRGRSFAVATLETLETPETHAADSGRGRSALASRRADRARRRSPSAPLFSGRAGRAKRIRADPRADRTRRRTPRRTPRRILSTDLRAYAPRVCLISRRRASRRSRRLPRAPPRRRRRAARRSEPRRRRGMATRIQAAFRGMRARRRRNALTSPLSTNTAS